MIEGALAQRMPPACTSSCSDRVGRLLCLADAHGANLELGDVRHGIDGANRQVVGRAVQRPVVGNEHRVGPNRLDHLSVHHDASAAALHFDEVAILHAEFFGEPRMHLAQRLRILVHQPADAARLRAGEEVRDDASGGQDDGILVIRHLRRRPPLDGQEVRLAVGMSELPAFIQARRSRMPDLGTRPEHSVVLVDGFPGDAVIVGDAAFRGDAQLLEDVVRRAVVELVAVAEARAQFRR